VHTNPWPVPSESGVDGGLLDVAGVVIRAIRKAKSDVKLSMKAPVDVVRVFGSQVSLVDAIQPDLLAAGNVTTIELTPSDEPLRVEVSLHTAEDVQ
jgi:valyl-tRNA synthetase